MHQQNVVMDRQLNASAEDLIGVLQDYSVPAEKQLAWCQEAHMHPLSSPSDYTLRQQDPQ